MLFQYFYLAFHKYFQLTIPAPLENPPCFALDKTIEPLSCRAHLKALSCKFCTISTTTISLFLKYSLYLIWQSPASFLFTLNLLAFNPSFSFFPHLIFYFKASILSSLLQNEEKCCSYPYFGQILAWAAFQVYELWFDGQYFEAYQLLSCCWD